MMKTLSGVVAFVIFGIATVPAVADVIPIDVAQCNTLSVGDSCASGTCQNSTCSRLDYAHWDRDASASPPSMTYACVRCLPGTGAGGSSSIGTSTAGSANKPDAGNEMGGPVGSCSCSLVGRTVVRVAPWLLAGVFWLPLLRRRLRKSNRA
jgi:hypothetical protein